MFLKAHEDSELTLSRLEGILVSVRAASWDTFV